MASNVPTGICILTQMEASCKNNSQSLILLDSFGLCNQYYIYLEKYFVRYSSCEIMLHYEQLKTNKQANKQANKQTNNLFKKPADEGFYP